MKDLIIRSRRILIALLTAAAVGLTFSGFAPAAFAVFSEPAKPTPKPTVKKVVKKKVLKAKAVGCARYKKTSRAYKNCIKPKKKVLKKKVSAFSDEAIYASGVALARAGEHQKALDMFRQAANQNDPRILTAIGFSTRKSRSIDLGLAYYAKALAIDPNYVQAREYLGEAYLQQGRFAAAQGQLSEIANRCGDTCDSYLKLEDAIRDYVMQQRAG